MIDLWYAFINAVGAILTYEIVKLVGRKIERAWRIRQGLRWECDRCAMKADGTMETVDFVRKTHYEMVPWHEFGETD